MDYRCLAPEEVSRQVSAMVDQRRFHIAMCWRAESFRSTEGQPMTIRRAEAALRQAVTSPI
jgi:hypothetical protein